VTRSSAPLTGAPLSACAALVLVLAQVACGARSTSVREVQGEDDTEPVSSEPIGDVPPMPAGLETQDTGIPPTVPALPSAEPPDASVPSSMGDDLEFYVEDGGASGDPVPITGPGECAVCVDTIDGNCVWEVCEGPCRTRATAARSCCAGRVCEGHCMPGDRCACGDIDGGCTEPLPACHPQGSFPPYRWSCGTTFSRP
jgi:hypothetical protein